MERSEQQRREEERRDTHTKELGIHSNSEDQNEARSGLLMGVLSGGYHLHFINK